MGTLWKAADLVLGREVAIKVLLGHRVDDEYARERFQREARLLAMLRHPGITVIHDYGDHDGQPFIVMELLTGRDLEQVMRGHRHGLPAGQAVELAAAHKQGVTHRDIKPANLFLQEGPVHDGRQLKVCDFGIAKDIAASSITDTGQAVGTPPFLAPEVWLGKPNSAKSDLYALGCVLYELLTGKPPFPVHLDRVKLRERHLTQFPPPPVGVPPRLGQLVTQLLAKDPDERPASAATVATDLRAIATGLAAPGPPPAPPPVVPPAASPVWPRPVGVPPHEPTITSADPTVRYTPPLAPEAPGQAGSADGSRPGPWTSAIRAAAWLLAVTTVIACLGIAAAGWAPMARLWVLVPAAAYTLIGALAVGRSRTRAGPASPGSIGRAPGIRTSGALGSFAVAEVAAILLVTLSGTPQAWAAAIMTLSWMSGVLLTTVFGDEK
jgi:hypothetical protein